MKNKRPFSNFKQRWDSIDIVYTIEDNPEDELMKNQSKVKKWGNSLGIRISKSVADEANIRENTIINLTVKDNTIILTPEHEKLRLEDFLSKITPENIHKETDYGDKTGKEIW